jgi:hypothetical protein
MPSLRQLTAAMPSSEFWCEYCMRYYPIALRARERRLVRRKGKRVGVPAMCAGCVRRRAECVRRRAENS